MYVYQDVYQDEYHHYVSRYMQLLFKDEHMRKKLRNIYQTLKVKTR